MGARARLQQSQAVILLHEIVQLAPDILVEPLEQEDVQLRCCGDAFFWGGERTALRYTTPAHISALSALLYCSNQQSCVKRTTT